MLEILFVEGESREIRKLRRVAELSKREIARKLAQRVDIRCELEVLLRSRIDVDRAKNKYLICGRGIQYLRDRFSLANFTNLIVIQADELAKKLIRLDRIVRRLYPTFAERKEKQEKQGQTRNSSAHGISSANKYRSLLPQAAPLFELGYRLMRLRAISWHFAPVLRQG